MEIQYELDLEALQNAPRLSSMTFAELVHESVSCVAGLAECFEYNEDEIVHVAGAILENWRSAMSELLSDPVKVIECEIEHANETEADVQYLTALKQETEEEQEDEIQRADRDFCFIGDPEGIGLVVQDLTGAQTYFENVLGTQMDLLEIKIEQLKQERGADEHIFCLEDLMIQLTDARIRVRTAFLSLFSHVYKSGLADLDLWIGYIDSLFANELKNWQMHPFVKAQKNSDDSLDLISALETCITLTKNILQSAIQFPEEVRFIDENFTDVIRSSVERVISMAEKAGTDSVAIEDYVSDHLKNWQLFFSATMDAIRSLPRADTPDTERPKVNRDNALRLEEFVRYELIEFMQRRNNEMASICLTIAEENGIKFGPVSD